MYDIIKVLITAILIVCIAEVSKVNAVIGGFIKSLPLISIMAMVWLYVQTKDVSKISVLSYSTFWFVLPTLPMFLLLPYLINRGLSFYISLIVSVAVMLIFYGITFMILKYAGVRL